MQTSTVLVGFDLIRSAVTLTGITGPEKAVLLVLATMANGQAQAWPPMTGETGLVAKCCLGERTVQRAIQALAANKHITREEKLGKGVVYTVHPRHSGTPATETPRQTDAPATQAATPATAAPKQPRTTIPKKGKPSLERAKIELPDDWAPKDFGPDTQSRKVVDGWPPGEVARQLEHFRAHHRKKGDRFRSWQDAWSTWVLNARAFGGQHGRSNPLAGHQSPDGLSSTARAALAVFGSDPGDGRGVSQ
jgi:hypothetical protein